MRNRFHRKCQVFIEKLLGEFLPLKGPHHLISLAISSNMLGDLLNTQQVNVPNITFIIPQFTPAISQSISLDRCQVCVSCPHEALLLSSEVLVF